MGRPNVASVMKVWHRTGSNGRQSDPRRACSRRWRPTPRRLILDAYLRGPEHVAGWMKRDLHTIDADRLAEWKAGDRGIGRQAMTTSSSDGAAQR
jgi:hypothetical protein